MGDPKSENIRKIKKALEQTGAHPKITRYDFCTNGSHYAGEAGIETFGFGPSSEKLAHTVDEYVTLPQIRGAVTGYEAILEALLNPGQKKQEAGK
jgi:acetylornithine deacetylase/succinyl-diaminopimelate desuccinylase-like protein